MSMTTLKYYKRNNNPPNISHGLDEHRIKEELFGRLERGQMELVPGKLYFYLDSVWRENGSGGRSTGDLIVSLDNSHKHVKSAKHFGPPILKTIWEHCNRVDSTRRSGRVFFLTNDKEDNLHTEQRTMSSFLMASYCILRLNWDVNTTNDALLASIPKKLAFFRDYHGDSNFKLNILDCLRGLYIGCKINRWFLSKSASVASKIYDMDWIAPNKLLALRDPTIRRETRRRSVSKVAVRELRRCGVTAIVRLNGQDHNHCLDYYGYSYEVEEMKREHFVHYEIPFEDVNIPTLHQVNQFVSFCEACDGPIAVHCHAGLGRSAAMIGCYMIKHYGFDSRSVVAWMKMCRSGSVMGPQHFFFERYEQYLKITRNSAAVSTKYKCRGIVTDVLSSAEIPAVSIPDAGTTKAKHKQISRPPRKNNIIHIVPGNRREIKKTIPSNPKPHLPVKGTSSGRELRITSPLSITSGNKRSRSVAVITPPSSGKSSEKSLAVSEKEKRTDKRMSRGNMSRSSSNPAAKLISRVMRTPAATPTTASRRRASEPPAPTKMTYKIPTCYVNITETDSHTKMADHIGNKKNAPSKGPTLMKGKLSKSHETLKIANSGKTSRKNLNSSKSWNERKVPVTQPQHPHSQPQAKPQSQAQASTPQYAQIVTRSMKKHYDTFGTYPKSVKGF